MHVVVTLVFHRGSVHVFLDYLHRDAMALAGCLPVAVETRDIVHRVVMRRLRPLLSSLCMLRVLQRRYEAQCAAERRAMGGFARSLRRCIDPVLLHDANTLYVGLMSSYFGNQEAAWFVSRPCSRCGSEARGLTCTPPFFSSASHRLVRPCLDSLVSFCWTCLEQQPASPPLGWPYVSSLSLAS